MEKQDLEFILQEGEGQKIEFKERNSGLAREMVALANARGGRIFLGVSDDNNVSGIAINNRLKSSVQDIARNCDPPLEIEFEHIEGADDVLVIVVNEGEDKPYRCSKGFYLRQGPNSQKLSRDQILDFSIGLGSIRFDEQLNRKFKFPDDFSPERLERYFERLSIQPDVPPQKALLNLDVAEDDSSVVLNNAGILFFAQKPSDFISTNKLTCVRFDGNSKTGGIIDRDNFREDLLTNVDETLRFIAKNTRTASKIIDFQRIDMPEYPNEAVREALLNAVMHRDYFIENAPVQVNIFNDRIEVVSPGALPKGVSLDTLGEMSVARNALITDLVLRTGLIDKLGTGIKRMKKIMDDHGLEGPEFEETADYFKVTLWGPGDDILVLIEEQEGTDLRESGLNERQIKALEKMLNNNEEMTNKKYRNEFDVSHTTAHQDLKKLVEMDFVSEKGQGRSKSYVAK